jgi:hypothetical protein
MNLQIFLLRTVAQLPEPKILRCSVYDVPAWETVLADFEPMPGLRIYVEELDIELS